MNSGLQAVSARYRFLSFPVRLLLLGLLLICLSSCATMTDFESSQERRGDLLLILRPGQTLVVNFTTRRPSFNAIQLWLSQSKGSSAVGNLNYRLLLATSRQELDAGRLPAAALNASPQTLKFEIASLPANTALILELSSDYPEIQVFGKAEDVLPSSSISIDGQTLHGDLAFRQQYHYGPDAALADLAEIMRHAWLVLPLLLVFWLPGHLLLAWLERPSFRETRDNAQRLGLALGLSMAFWPVLLLWSTAVSWRWNAVSLWALSAAMAILALWRWIHRLRQSAFKLRPRWPKPDQTLLILLIILCCSGFIRFAMVRDLAAPAWVDSVHHALLTRLTIEQGGFPRNYSPYLPGESASYHPGFHGITAVLIWLSGLELSAGLQLTGQVMNAMAVIAAYLFSWTFTRSQPAALSAALITGLLSPMPAYYASWGRFTQLSGLLVLPTGLALLLMLERLFRRKHLNLRLTVLAGFSLAGLLLLHYRVILFLLALLTAISLNRFLAGFLSNPWKISLSRLTASIAWLQAGLMAIWLSLPWWLVSFSTLFAAAQRAISSEQPLFYDFNWRHLTAAGGTLSLALAGLGLLLSLLRRRPLAMHLLTWVALLFLMANPSALNLPGNGWINNTSVVIALFFPISTLAGEFLGRSFQLARNLAPFKWRIAIQGLAGLSGLALGAWGASRLLPLINPTTVLFHEADRAAMIWIAENTPKDTGVLINPFFWGYDTYAGSDGGFWIAPLACRRTLPPPVLLGLSASPEEFNYINTISRQALELAHQPAELHRLMRQAGLNYLYIGARGGAFSAEELSRSPYFILRFQHAGTYLFEISPPP